MRCRFGKEYVANLVAFSHMVSALLQREPRLKPLIVFIIGTTESSADYWEKRKKKLGDLSYSPIDIAFRETAGYLARHLHATPESEVSFSLDETTQVMSRLWSEYPKTQNPMSAEQIAAFMREVSELFCPHPSWLTAHDPEGVITLTSKLGEMVFGKKSFFAESECAIRMLQVMADTYELMDFDVHEKDES